MPLDDHSILTRHGDYSVLTTQHEVSWPDGSRILLHPVSVHGSPEPFLRALHQGGLHWVVFDLRKLVPVLDADMRRLPPRDAQGVVFYSLRHAFANAATAMLAAMAHRDMVWLSYAPEQPRRVWAVAA